MSVMGKTTLLSLSICDVKDQNPISIQSKLPEIKPLLTLRPGEFSLTEHAPFVRLRRGKPTTFPAFVKECLRFALLHQPAQPSATSPVSLASSLPASPSDYNHGKSATAPTRSSVLFPSRCQMTSFCVFPNSALKGNLSPKTEGSSHAH